MTEADRIQLVDLKAQYSSIRNDIDKAVLDCISETSFIRGKVVGEFENNFAHYLGSKFCISCGNGTDALEIILKSIGIGSGDEVLVPALTWIATAEAVNNTGAEPVFVDVNSVDYTIDTTRIEEKITKKTRAIIPVHLYGSPAGMEEIMQISQKHKLHVIEDCAQAHGAEYNGKKVGTFGIASAFSFFPSKNLGAFGDAGGIVTNDQKISEYARMLTNHGQLKTRHAHSIIGRNSRMDTIQAAVLNVKLPYLDEWNKKRIAAAGYYKEKLSKSESLIMPFQSSVKKHVYHLFVIQMNKRDEMINSLDSEGISSSIHYPVPLPFVDAYKYKLHSESEFPVAVKLANRVLSLPIYPEISKTQLDRICEQIKKHL